MIWYDSIEYPDHHSTLQGGAETHPTTLIELAVYKVHARPSQLLKRAQDHNVPLYFTPDNSPLLHCHPTTHERER